MSTTQKRGVSFAAAIAIVLFMAAIIGVKTAEALVTSTLSPGNSGAAVSELQSFLASDTSVYPESLVTGFYGELTAAAVQRFQCKQNIVCDGSVDTTGYGRVGPVTLAKIQSMQTPGVPNTGSSFMDDSGPLMTAEIVTTSSTTANITWTTNEPSENAVLYASAWPFYIGNAKSAWSSTFTTVANVTITGLLPNHTYAYVRQSVDATGNVQYAIGHAFTTNSQ